MADVVVLFARSDSVYYTLGGTDVFDQARDARTYVGSFPVVAHPPCRGWGRLRAFAKPRADELDLARFGVAQVRRVGGVLEHPEASALWADQSLPLGKRRDEWGGFTLALDQGWFGHRARKATWLYVVGVSPADVPPIAYSLDVPSHVVCRSRGLVGAGRNRREVSKAERERTPPRFAEFLVDLARRCRRG
jgi:hypothetical protein